MCKMTLAGKIGEVVMKKAQNKNSFVIELSGKDFYKRNSIISTIKRLEREDATKQYDINAVIGSGVAHLHFYRR